MDAAQDEEDTRFTPTSTDAERQVMAAIVRSQQALLCQYERAIETRAALDEEQRAWCHQSPAKRGVNTSPKNSWSTSRRLNPVSSKKHTKNPPAFHTDDVHQCSLKNARRTSENLARIIDTASAKNGSHLGRSVVKTLGFAQHE
jgi:hypothetical protein